MTKHVWKVATVIPRAFSKVRWTPQHPGYYCACQASLLGNPGVVCEQHKMMSEKWQLSNRVPSQNQVNTPTSRVLLCMLRKPLRKSRCCLWATQKHVWKVATVIPRAFSKVRWTPWHPGYYHACQVSLLENPGVVCEQHKSMWEKWQLSYQVPA
jgi:hypothetical protein